MTTGVQVVIWLLIMVIGGHPEPPRWLWSAPPLGLLAFGARRVATR